jgi:hypothetical protein
MSSESFDLITQELLKHQQAMELLQAENRELRQQLTDLRTGRGIFIEINGQRFALNASFISRASMEASSVESSSSLQQQASPSIADKPTTAISKVSLAETAEIAYQAGTNKQVPKSSSSNFLEEAMISEFASALASHLTLLQDPIKPQERQKQENIEEEQKAVLRRDLMGSYLLD